MSDVDDVNGNDVDPISSWIFQHPEVWDDAVTPLDDDRIDALVDRVIGRAQAQQRRYGGQRRRKVIAVGAVTGMLVVAGAVGAAALLRGQPSQPIAGIACQDGIGDDAVVVAIDPTDDPIGGCEAAWRAGRFNEDRDQPTEPPKFIACIGSGGAVQVHPLDFGTCEELGLAAADPALDDDNRSVVELNDRIVAEVNSSMPCLSATDAGAIAERVLDDSGLRGWRVEIRTDSAVASCAKAAVVFDRKVIEVIKFP